MVLQELDLLLAAAAASLDGTLLLGREDNPVIATLYRLAGRTTPAPSQRIKVCMHRHACD